MPDKTPEFPRNPDVLIIGAGAIGICSAYYLRDEHVRTCVIDRGETGAGCSFGNAGLIVPSHSIPLASPSALVHALKWFANADSPFYIKPRLNRKLLSWLWRFGMACRRRRVQGAIAALRDLSRASLTLHRELAGRDGADYSFAQTGMLAAFQSNHGLEEGMHEASVLRDYGIPSTVLGQADVHELVPELDAKIIGGIHYSDDAHLEPARFVDRLATWVLQKGATIVPRTEVLGFKTSGGNIRVVKTTQGDFRPAQVVLASGSWSPCLTRDLGVRIPVEPAKGYSITFRRPAHWSSVPVMLSEHKVAVTPMGRLLRFAGTLELAGLDFSINRRRVRAIWRAVQQCFVDTSDLELLELWRGLRPLSPDGLPIIGRSRSSRNLIVATGHGMLGMSLGPVSGKLVSEIACDKPTSIDISAFAVDRF